MQLHSNKNLIVKAYTVLVFVLFIFSVFRHISYPLFWNDEGMTAMYSKRVLEYGYPKISDGKNVVYDIVHTNPDLGKNIQDDAVIAGPGWLHYYLIAPAIWMAKGMDDIYIKTGFLRSWVALFGLLGLFLCFYFTVKIIPDTKGKWFFTAAVLTACLFSVIFTTHLRELRYYNFVLLINATLVAIYTKDKFTNEKPGRLYYILVPVLLLLQLLNFLPGFFAFGFAVFLFEAITIGNAWRKGGKSAAFKASVLDSIRFMIPILISFLYLIPYNIYFQAFHINGEMNAYNLGVGFQTGYLDNLKRVLNYYQDFEWVFAFILFKVMVIALRGKIVKAIPGLEKMLSYSDFLFIFWAVFLLIVSNAPNFVFVRYHFGVIPFLWIILFLDLGVLLRFAYASGENQKAIFVTGIFIVLASNMTYVWVGQEKYFTGKMNEIKYQYKGPLDFVIPWIVKNIPDYQSRNVATNYEEASLMYYLDCKVSFGFLGSQFVPANIERADVIFFRNFWIRTEEQVDLLKALVSKDAYETISFKGKDVPFNRLPEPYSGKNKLEKISASKTLLATHPEDETRIFVRKKLVEDKKLLKPNPE